MTRDRELTPEEETAIATFMRTISAAPVAAAWSLPPADVVLRQARWRRRWDGERRMHAPLDIVVPLQIAAGLGATAVLIVRAVPLLAMTLQHYLA